MALKRAEREKISHYYVSVKQLETEKVLAEEILKVLENIVLI